MVYDHIYPSLLNCLFGHLAGANSSCGTDPAETKETNETVMEEPSSAVVLPEDIAAQAEVLTDHLIRFVMTPEWMEEPFEYTDENIFRFLVSLPTVQCPV